MGRLIDADKLLNEIEEAALEVEKKMKGRRIGKTLAQGCLTGLACVREAVKRQPPAYDPDKVVKQLWDVSFERFDCDTGMGGELVVNMDDAIEIVKAGGADAEH